LAVTLVNLTLVAVPSQIIGVKLLIVNAGLGFTVTLKICTGPPHPAFEAEILTGTVTGEVTVLIAVKEGISKGALLSEPFGNPAEAPPVQVNVSPPPVLALRLIKATVAPLQAT
jgi:hypothetical protein